MGEWCNRPLEPVYPVVFIDAIYVKIRDGQATSRPIYVAVGVTCAGERDILGLWPATAGRDMERAQVRFRRLVLLPDVFPPSGVSPKLKVKTIIVVDDAELRLSAESRTR